MGGHRRFSVVRDRAGRWLFLIGALFFLLAAAAESVEASESIVDKVEMVGLGRADKQTIRHYITQRVGAPLNRAATRADTRKIYNLGFFDKIDVDLIERGSQTVLRYRFEEKPFVKEVRFKGVDGVSEKDLIAATRVSRGTFFRQDHLPWDISRIKSVYRAKGFYAAKIKVNVIEVGQNMVLVEFDIDEGSKIRIARINFEGNRAFSEVRLLEQMNLSTYLSAPIFTRRSIYRKDALKGDLVKLESLYRDNGHIDARVGEAEVEIDYEARNVYINVPIEEGEAYRVGSISIKGDEVFSSEELSERFPLKEGEIFNQGLFQRYVYELIDLYAGKGRAYADVITKIEPDGENLTVALSAHVEPGPRVYLGQITITGNEKTLDRVIRRQFRLTEGEIFDSVKVNRSKLKITQLGFFDSVEFARRARPETNYIDLETKVIERRTGKLIFAVGYSSAEKLTTQGEVRFENLRGRGQELGLGVTKSAEREDYNISFTENALFDRELSAGVDFYKELRRNTDEVYELDSYGLRPRLGKSIGDFTWLNLGYRYERGEVVIVDRDEVSAYLREREGLTITSSIAPSITYDTRDDRYNASRGSFVKLYTEMAGLGGTSKFYKWNFEVARFFDLTNDFLLLCRGKAGYVAGYGGKDVPITDRYFMGGSKSLRGFRTADIGPQDENGSVIGGNALLLFNVELQYLFTNAFRAFLFYDRGNVYGDNDAGGNTTDRYYDLDEMRHSWGFGTHFFSPLGPITLAYGIKLDRRADETPSEFHFTIGGLF